MSEEKEGKGKTEANDNITYDGKQFRRIVGRNFWNPQKDDPEKLHGVLIEVQSPDHVDEFPIYVVESMGEKVFLPTHMDLMRKMENVPIGTEVLIRLVGEYKTDQGHTGLKYNVYEATE